MIAELQNITRRIFGAKPSRKTQAVDPVIAEVVRPEPIRDLAMLVDDMLRDPMCVITLGVLLASIKRADVTITLTTDTEDDPRAEAIQHDIQRLWLETLEKLVDPRNGVLTWGGLPFEIVIENTEETGVPITRIKTLKQLPKHISGSRATELVLDSDGQFGGIRVTINGSDFVIPAEQSCWIAIGATPLEPHGRSLFLGAPQAVRARRRKTDELFDAFISRWAISGPTVHAPALAYDQFNNPINNHELIARQFATNYKNGAVTIFPNTPAGPGMDGRYEIDITHETRALDSKPLETIDSLIDAKMSRAFGVHEAVTMDTGTGSYASQTVRMFVVLSQCDSYVSQIVAGFRSVVERVYLRANYADGSAAVSLTIMPVSLVTDGFLIETVKSILAMPQWGPLLESGAIDVATILANAGIPLASDYVERIDEAFAAVAAAKEQAAQQFEEEPEEEFEEDDDPFAMANDDAHYLAVKKKAGRRARPSGRPHAPRPVVAKRDGPPVGGVGSNQYGRKGTSKGKPQAAQRKPKRVETKPDTPVAKTAIGYNELKHAYNVEKQVHGAVGGTWESDNKFYDVALPNNRDFLEVKSMTKGSKSSLSVHADALLRKVEGIQAAGKDAVMHTMLADDRPGAAHRLYYRRGSGAYSLASMHRVKDLHELKRLIATPDAKLPQLARGALPHGKELELLRVQAKTAQESRRKKDQAYKARLKAAGTSAYIRAADRVVSG